VVRVAGNGEAGKAGHGTFLEAGLQFNWDLTPIK